jgi:hypothetical protein
MGMAATLFILWLIMVVPSMASNIDLDGRTDAELMETFASHPAYLAMYERFPDAVEALESDTRGGSLRVGAMDFEGGAQLILYMDIHGDHNVRTHVECIRGDETPRMVVDSLFTAEFIRATDCLGPT